MLTRVSLALFTLALLAPAVAGAQFYSVPSPNLTIITNSVANQAFTQSVINPPAQEAKVPPSRPVANPATLRFVPNLATRQRNLAAFVSSSERETSGAGASLKAFFDAGDPVTVTTGVIAPLGLETDNLADVLTFYMFSHWMAVNGITTMPSRAQIAGLRNQMERALLASRQFDRTPNADKQKAAESMMISGLLTIGALAGAEGSAASTSAVSARAAQNVKGIGLDLAALKLTSQGLVAAR